MQSQDDACLEEMASRIQEMSIARAFLFSKWDKERNRLAKESYSTCIKEIDNRIEDMRNFVSAMSAQVTAA